MEKMTSRLAVAAAVASVAVLGAGCAADAAAPAGGHPSAAAAGSPALPNPFTILARYDAKSLRLDHPGVLAIAHYASFSRKTWIASDPQSPKRSTRKGMRVA